jgi:putative phosphoesterase
MKIAIISDIHDNAHNLSLFLSELHSNKDIKQIIFLGDFVGAAIANLLKSSSIPVYGIWGNNDGDHHIITKISYSQNSNLKMGCEVFDIVEFDTRKIFLTHYPMLALPMAKSGDFDAVFYGHDHVKHKSKISDCLVINPGEIGAYKTGVASYAIYDTKTNDAQIITISNTITTNTDIAKAYFKKIGLKWNQGKGHKK